MGLILFITCIVIPSISINSSIAIDGNSRINCMIAINQDHGKCLYDGINTGNR